MPQLQIDQYRSGVRLPGLQYGMEQKHATESNNRQTDSSAMSWSRKRVHQHQRETSIVDLQHVWRGHQLRHLTYLACSWVNQHRGRRQASPELFEQIRLHQHAAVDPKNLAGDVGGKVRNEE